MPKTTPREDAVLKAMDKNPNAPRYVNCDLNAAQKASLLAFIEDTGLEDLISWLEARVGDNYTLSMKSLDVGYQCSLTGSSKQRDNANVCLISRASTPTKAAYSVFYKDTQVLMGKWPVTNRIEELDA